MWWAILGSGLACFLVKYAGLSVPRQRLANARVQRVAALLPVALLSTLILTQTFTQGHHLTFDARAAGLIAAACAQVLRAPFLVVVAVAAFTTALFRLLLA